jgi:hypothetical protein
MKVYFNMNDQDQKTFYTGMILLGLLVRGAPVASIPETTQHLIVELMKTQSE